MRPMARLILRQRKSSEKRSEKASSKNRNEPSLSREYGGHHGFRRRVDSLWQMLADALQTRRELEGAMHATDLSTNSRRSSHEPTGRSLFARETLLPVVRRAAG